MAKIKTDIRVYADWQGMKEPKLKGIFKNSFIMGEKCCVVSLVKKESQNFATLFY